MNRTVVMWAAALGCIAIILGALGAHALKESLSADSLSSFETGVRYQAWHAIALLALGFSNIEFPFKKLIYRLWVIGTILFSFSIYLLSTSAISGLELSFLGPITPIGGLLMILGWLMLFIGALKYSKSQNQGIS